MASGTGRKRPWEDERPIEGPSKRRGSTTVAGERHASLLPQPVGYYSHDRTTAIEPPSHSDRNRLPPLSTSTPTCTASAVPLTAGPLRPSPPLLDHPALDSTRPRSQSLFDLVHHARCEPDQNESERTRILPARLDLSVSVPSLGADLQHSRLGISRAAQEAGGLICCSSDCSGQVCSNTRSLMRKLASGLTVLDATVRSLVQADRPSPSDLPQVNHASVGHSLQWALDTVQWTSLKLQAVADIPISHHSEQNSLQADASSTMRRGPQHHPDREEPSPPGGHFPGAPSEHGRYPYPPPVLDDGRRNVYGGEMAMPSHSPHHPASSPSGSFFMPPQSPMQAPQPSRPGMLPSPSSISFQNVPNLPPISSPSSSLQTSAQAVHLQDLQHQISVKTLEFQTLKREYDSLLQKLDRQRTKCATLEKKFEVSDREINDLNDQKEQLQSQIGALENQVEELQKSRDDARRQLVGQGAQYMRIMEMANRLQAQGSEDKKRWEEERGELEQRIRVLEEAMVTGFERPTTDTNDAPSQSTTTQYSASTSASSAETINVLRAEIVRLRSRTQALESALRTLREESVSIQAAARELLESGGRIERACDGTMR